MTKNAQPHIKTVNLTPSRNGYIRCLEVIANYSTNKVDRVWAKRQLELIVNEDKQEAK